MALRTAYPRPTTSTLLHRLQQGLAALRPRLPVDRDAILAATLSAPQTEAFRRLPIHDQAHLCRVYRALRDDGVIDPDLLAATLLHDIGKLDPNGPGHVRLIDRVARVVLARLAPALLHRLSRPPAPRWRRGLALAVHHPALGAEHAAALGSSDRTCWLIAHHHDASPTDPDLRRLIAADRAAH